MLPLVQLPTRTKWTGSTPSSRHPLTTFCYALNNFSFILRQLELAAEKDKFNFKILLLGAGESGKSTVVKQIKLIWKVNGGMTDQEKYEYTDALKRNVIEVMQTLIEAAQYLDISLFGEEEKEGADDTELEVYAREVLEADVAAEGGFVFHIHTCIYVPQKMFYFISIYY